MSCAAEPKRLFFALDPDDGVRGRIVSIQGALELPARKVAAENLHITLAFLGDVPGERIGDLRALAEELRLPACRLTLDRSGWFPRSGVVWLGSDAPPEELSEFQSALCARLAEGGFRSESRAWVPHVTLYRKMRKPCARMVTEAVDWQINGFSLKQSILGRTGPVYSALDRWSAVP